MRTTRYTIGRLLSLLLSLLLLAGCAPQEKAPEGQNETAEPGSGESLSRPASDSPWLGYYERADGAGILVCAADGERLYAEIYSPSEDGWFTRARRLEFLDAEKKRARMSPREGDGGDLVSFALTETGIAVTVEPAGGNLAGDYSRQADKFVLQKNEDGSESWLGADGAPVPYSRTQEGWMTDEQGRVNRALGMADFDGGEYQTIFSEEKGEIEAYLIRLRQEVVMPEKKRPLGARVEIGTVDYLVYGADGTIRTERYGMRLFNSANGYEIESGDGKIFAWLFPFGMQDSEIGVENYLMVQRRDSEEYQSFFLASDAEEDGPSEWDGEPTEMFNGNWEMLRRLDAGTVASAGQEEIQAQLKVDCYGSGRAEFRWQCGGEQREFLGMAYKKVEGSVPYDGFPESDWCVKFETDDPKVELYGAFCEQEMLLLYADKRAAAPEPAQFIGVFQFKMEGEDGRLSMG